MKNNIFHSFLHANRYLKLCMLTITLCFVTTTVQLGSSVYAQYEADLAALSSDCAILKFLLLNKIINGAIVLHSVLGWVQALDVTVSNLDCCDLGFRPFDPSSFPYKVDISGLQLIGGTARGARFEHAFLGRVRFDGSDLSPGTVADGCPGQITSFRYSVVPDGSFISFIGTATHPTLLISADISEVLWANTSFLYANLTNANLSYSDFHTVLISGANLTNANFYSSRIRYILCDPNNLPIVSNTILPDGRRTSNALDFCRFCHDHHHHWRPQF